ncbi:DUF948 domain-containing protein [candidate division KSB1 bacterium]|nr:DUF948 domain-containing protein [candidate division KSB1 bacterium]
MLLEISVVIIAAFIVILILVLIPVLVQIFRAVRQAEKLLETVRQHVPPIAHDLAIMLHDARDISSSTNRQVAKIEDSVNKFKNFERIFETKIIRPFLELIAVLSGLMKGLNVFVRHLRQD